MQWRHVFDKRTGSLSWQTVRDVYAKFALPELAEIVENNIHFAQVRQIEGISRKCTIFRFRRIMRFSATAL